MNCGGHRCLSAIDTVTVPILHQGGILIASILSELTDSELLEFRDRIAQDIGERRPFGIVIDLSALDLMDSFAMLIVQHIADTSRLRGVRAVIAGIQPDVALAMVQLGLNFRGVTTAVDLDEALATLGVSSARLRPNGS
jgi:rsbT antagonist protein RsbS